MAGSASDNAFQIRRALQMLLPIVGDGAAAVTEANEAIIALKTAREKLEGSRIHALQQLGELNRAIDLVSPLAFGTNSLALTQALEMLVKARKEIEKYVNGIVFRRENLGKVITQLQSHVKDTIDESGMSIRIAVIDLEDYAQNNL